jgi:hypothetical protein
MRKLTQIFFLIQKTGWPDEFVKKFAQYVTQQFFVKINTT